MMYANNFTRVRAAYEREPCEPDYLRLESTQVLRNEDLG